MDLFTIITILIVLAAIFGFINEKFFKMPDTIGLMVITIIGTLIAMALGWFDNSVYEWEKAFVGQIDFYTVLMEGFLCILLFAGALHTDFEALKAMKWPIIAFSTIGVLISTFLVAGLLSAVLGMLDISIPFIHCLLFGALISPTDPIAVLGILKKAGVPKALETKIVGESLFNDGIGVVVFLTILSIAQSGSATVDFSEIGLLFIEEVGGGLLLGLGLGWLAYYLMKQIDSYEIEVIITLAVVLGGYLLASKLHFSGPLAMVVAGLVVGNERFRTSSMSEVTELYVDKFWELLDVLFNTVLFVLIGLELVVLQFTTSYFIAGLLAIPLVLLARYISLFGPIQLFKRKLNFVPNTNLVMTWGGLRGGISIALALSLAPEFSRELLLTITYTVVVFSIVVQGLSVGTLVKKVIHE